MKSLCLFICLFSLFGCSAHKVSTEIGVSKGAIYDMDESQMFNLIYSSIQEVFPQEKISVITEPARGYITKFYAPPLHVDYFTQKVLVHRSSGLDLTGRRVYGYWVEVSGSGSSFLQGQLKNSELFETIISHLESSAKKKIVLSIAKEPYLLSQENFYIKGSDTLQGYGERIVIARETDKKNSSIDDLDYLRELHNLKLDGVITEQEFEAAKQKLLNK